MRADDILQSCIDEVLSGHKTPAECAAAYPEFPDFEANLKMALALRAMQAITLSAAADRRIEARLRQRARALKSADRSAAQRPAASKLRWLLAPSLAAILLLGGVGISAAASNSNPGDALYGVKRADENAEIFLT